MAALRIVPVVIALLALWTGGLPAVQVLTPLTDFEPAFATFYGDHALVNRLSAAATVDG